MSKLINLDIKDKRILRELLSNGRMSFSKVAKKVGLSKEVVQYRYYNLIKKGLLIGVNTVYDINKIGLKTFFVYVKFQSVDTNTEEEIINYLTQHPNIAWLVKCVGNFDLILKFFVKDNLELSHMLKELEKQYPLFKDFSIDTIETEIPIPLAYLYSPLKPDSMKSRERGLVKIDELDIQIMEQLAKNSRKQLSEISTELKTPRDTIKYRIKRLEKEGVIITYRPSAWSGTKSLGYSWYHVLINYKQLEKNTRNTLFSYITTQVNMAYLYELIGGHDLAFEIRLKTGDELNDVLMKIREILGSDFKSNELSLILKEYKYTYFVDAMKELK